MQNVFENAFNIVDMKILQIKFIISNNSFDEPRLIQKVGKIGMVKIILLLPQISNFEKKVKFIHKLLRLSSRGFSISQKQKFFHCKLISRFSFQVISCKTNDFFFVEILEKPLYLVILGASCSNKNSNFPKKSGSVTCTHLRSSN